MKVIILGDKFTISLFNLIGCEGYHVDTEHDLHQIVKQTDFGQVSAVLTTSKVFSLNPKYMSKIREQNVAVITLDTSAAIMADQVEKVLGIKLKNLST